LIKYRINIEATFIKMELLIFPVWFLPLCSFIFCYYLTRYKVVLPFNITISIEDLDCVAI